MTCSHMRAQCTMHITRSCSNLIASAGSPLPTSVTEAMRAMHRTKQTDWTYAEDVALVHQAYRAEHLEVTESCAEGYMWCVSQ